MGISVQSVYGWAEGSIPKAERIERLAELLGVSLQWLAFGEGEIKAMGSETGGIIVPLLNIAHSAGFNGGGNGSWVDAPIVARLLELDPVWVTENLTCLSAARNLAMVHVSGDSMEPTLHNSDIVLVDRGVSHINREGIFAVTCDDGFYIKRFQRILGSRLMMISDNQFYKPQEFDPQDKSLKFEVCGLALWAWQGKRLFDPSQNLINIESSSSLSCYLTFLRPPL